MRMVIWEGEDISKFGRGTKVRIVARRESGGAGDYYEVSIDANAMGDHQWRKADDKERDDILRMVATVERNGEERFIAYMLLKPGVLEADQHRGIQADGNS